MDIVDLRQQIDDLDAQIVACFCKRMEIASAIADYKRENGLPIYVPEREAAILQKISQQADPEFAEDVKRLYRNIFEISRDHQHNRNAEVSK